MTRIVDLDFETCSSTELKTAGAWAYAECPSTEVLCVVFHMDGWAEPCRWLPGDDTRQLTMLAGEPTNIFVAHNAGFEQAIWHHIMVPTFDFPPIPVERWEDTMAMAAWKSLPLKLEKAAGVLHLPLQKDMDGSRLTIGMSRINRKTQMYPERPPEKLTRIADYCAQDVAVESQLRHRLGLLKDQSPHERGIWLLDQKINQRGVRIDLEFVRAAQQVVDRATVPLLAEFRDLTSGINPGQRDKVIAWANGQGVELENLQKGYLETLLGESEDTDDAGYESLAGDGEADHLQMPGALPATVRRVLEIRQMLGSASIKKLARMRSCVGADGRARGLLQYHAAHPGRWCLTGDHEVLTPDGWVQLDEWNGGHIACWNQHERISFQPAKSLSFEYAGELLHHRSQRIDQIATPEHKMPSWCVRTGVFETRLVADKGRWLLPFHGMRECGAALDADLLRVLVMVQADGYYTPEGHLRLKFKKLRKIERCKTLLRRAGIFFKMEFERGGPVVFVIRRRHTPLFLRMFKNKTFGSWVWDCDPQVFFDELELWDGSRCGPHSIQYTTTNGANADVVQTFAHLSGRAASRVLKTRDGWNDCHVVNIWLTPGRHEVRSAATPVPFVGRVYCAETPTGFFLVRRNSKIWVTGNSGRLLQPQNFPRGTLKVSPDQAVDAIMSGDPEYVEMVLGAPAIECIASSLRHALVADPGKVFCVGDFAGIEARIVLALAGQADRVRELVEKGSGVYLSLAERIYGKAPGEWSATEELVEHYKHALKPEYTAGKGGVLGCGFQCGPANFNIKFLGGADLELAETVVRTYRKDWAPKVPPLWYALERAAVRAVRDGVPVEAYGVTYKREDDWLTASLPSGWQKIWYPLPRLFRDEQFDKDAWRYTAFKGGKMSQVKAYGGLLTENTVQGLARGLLAASMMRLERANYPIVLTVHDEAVCEVDEDKADLHEFEQLMAEPTPWADRIGIPIAVEAWIGERYRK